MPDDTLPNLPLDGAAQPDAAATGAAGPPGEPFLPGLIEFYGQHEAGGSWVFGGWGARAWLDAPLRACAAQFERGAITGDILLAQYDRSDLPPASAGFLLLIQDRQRRAGRLRQLVIDTEDGRLVLGPAEDAREQRGRPLLDHSLALVRTCKPGAASPAIADILQRRFVGEAYLDAYGYYRPAGGWFICGWVSNDWVSLGKANTRIAAAFARTTLSGASTIAFYEREDLGGRGVGFVLHLAAPPAETGALVSVSLQAGLAVVIARPSGALAMLSQEATATGFQAIIAEADPGDARDRLSALITRHPDQGRDPQPEISDQILLEFDEVIACPNDGLLLLGWMLARPGAIRAMRLVAAGQSYPIDLDRRGLWLDRPDVLESIGRPQGFDDPACGFLVRVPAPVLPDARYTVELDTADGGIGRKPLPHPRLHGLAAIKRVLGCRDLQFADIDSLFDGVLGPAIAALNAQRLERRPRVSRLDLGPRIEAPLATIIIPLYGRIDFMEIQLALFATLGLSGRAEILYVLDDPPKARDCQFLAASLYARFKLPFSLLVLERNVGFAPANNIGLAAARGEFVCFMNSDVLPTTGDWLERLLWRLQVETRLGVVGPVLLFEDGSVQHQGIDFKPLPQYAGWMFPHHTRKGFRRPATTGGVRQHAITGACMLLRRKTALDCGGFDEAFIIGDFEDTDLCFKLALAGLSACVDFGVAMYHLERKSQASSANPWRSNLTVYNAWVHERRWGRKARSLAATA